MRELPAPVSTIAPQLATAAPLSVKLTVPVGALPVTVAVRVTLVPTTDGLLELDTTVVVADLALTTCDSGELLDEAFEPSPEYAATMLCVPVVSAAVLHAAVRALPDPVSATAPQLAMLVPPSVKLTVPVGALPVTVAVKVTLAPTIEGLAELVIPVAVPDVLTTCDSTALLDAVLPASPEYPATIPCVPAVSELTLQTAVRVFPDPVSATAPQLAMLVPPSVKLTLPVGALPVTDAVKVTLAPTMDGLIELTRAVLVAALALTT